MKNYETMLSPESPQNHSEKYIENSALLLYFTFKYTKFATLICIKQIERGLDYLTITY